MSLIIKPGQGVLFMKVGTHASEPLKHIIERKRREIDQAGVAFWGYGGSTCHPERMVQPFARAHEQRGQVIYLVMQPMDSRHFAETLPAKQFSVDGVNWVAVNPAITVIGSRYALVIRDLKEDHFKLPLARTRVALGNSKGLIGSRYISGRVDKACLEISEEEGGADESAPPVEIGVVAELTQPYAVYVR